MLCSQCQTQMYITRTAYETEGDTSLITPTKVFYRPYFSCVNPDCPTYEREIAGERVELI